MFFAYLIFNPNCPFCMGYSLCIVAIFGHFQNALIFRILAVFSSRFLHRTTLMCLYKRFSDVFAYSIFNPNCPFCMGYSFCIVAIFGHFQNALIFRILAVFSSRFLHRTTLMCLYKRFSDVFAYSIFNPNCPFFMGYSLCIVAIFGHFQNAFIFRILAVFSSRFFA